MTAYNQTTNTAPEYLPGVGPQYNPPAFPGRSDVNPDIGRSQSAEYYGQSMPAHAPHPLPAPSHFNSMAYAHYTGAPPPTVWPGPPVQHRDWPEPSVHPEHTQRATGSVYPEYRGTAQDTSWYAGDPQAPAGPRQFQPGPATHYTYATAVGAEREANLKIARLTAERDAARKSLQAVLELFHGFRASVESLQPAISHEASLEVAGCKFS